MRKIIIVLIVLFAVTANAKTKWFNATSLTGGTTGSLDSANGMILSDGDRAIVATSTQIYFYYLDADSAAAESSPDTISPDSNAGDKRWILIQSIVP